MTKHRHHIIPKHQGGSDDPSNIALLSVEEHAEAHRVLFEKFGREEDRIAWSGLSGLIDKFEVVRRAQSLGGKKSVATNQPWKRKTATNWAISKNNQEAASILAHSEEAKKKRSSTYAKIKHPQGQK